MPPHKEIIILGDIEMGGGTLTDDFIGDRALSGLIQKFSRRKLPVDLVLNGDTFDFLKCPVIENKQFVYKRHLTKEVSLAKLKLVHSAHLSVFKALSVFLKNYRNNLYFTYGNHDLDLVFPEIQDELKKILGSIKRVHFGVKYRLDGVYAEHGMQYDFLNKADFKKIFLLHRGQELLNLSWVSFGLISQFMRMKEEHPFMERIMNRKKLFGRYPAIPKKITFQAAAYFFKSMAYYPWRYLTDPTYAFPKGLFREFIRRVGMMHWDVDQVIDIFKHHHKNRLEDKIYVLSHIHDKIVEKKDGRVIVHPGSWRDEYELVKGKLVPRTKRYVQILVTEKGHDYKLVDCPTRRSGFEFRKVVRNEKRYVRIAAEEEGFCPGGISPLSHN